MGYPSLGGGKKVQVPKAILEEAVSDPMKGCPEWHMEEGQQEYKMTLYNHGKVGLPSWPGASREDTYVPFPAHHRLSGHSTQSG